MTERTKAVLTPIRPLLLGRWGKSASRRDWFNFLSWALSFGGQMDGYERLSMSRMEYFFFFFFFWISKICDFLSYFLPLGELFVEKNLLCFKFLRYIPTGICGNNIITALPSCLYSAWIYHKFIPEIKSPSTLYIQKSCFHHQYFKWWKIPEMWM